MKEKKDRSYDKQRMHKKSLEIPTPPQKYNNANTIQEKTKAIPFPVERYTSYI